MTDMPTLAATLLANFATVRIPRCEPLWSRSDPDLSLRHHIELRSIASAGDRLVADCHRHHLRQCLLEDGHRAFLIVSRAVGQTDGDCTFSVSTPQRPRCMPLE